MRKIAIALMAFVWIGGEAGATSLCNSGNPRNTTSLNADGGCSVGGLLFNNFQYLAAAGNPSPEIDLVSASVDNTGTVNVTFNPNMSANGTYQDIYFLFSVTGGVNQVDLTVGGLNATINEVVCRTAMNLSSPSCAPQNTLANIVAFSAPPGPNSALSNVFPTTATIYVFKDIGVSPTYPNPTGGALTTFTQSFHLGLPNDVPGGNVPEPMSSALFGSGLAGMLAFYIRKRSR